MNPNNMQPFKGYDDLSALRNKSSRNLRRMEAKKKKNSLTAGATGSKVYHVGRQ